MRLPLRDTYVKIMKVIIIQTPQGEYVMPMSFVVNSMVEEDALYLYEELMDNPDEVCDWLINNTDWSDWKRYAKKANTHIHVTEDDFWCNMDCLEVEEWSEQEFRHL